MSSDSFVCFIFILSFPPTGIQTPQGREILSFWFTAIYCIIKEQRLSVLELCPSEGPQTNAENYQEPPLSRASSPLPASLRLSGVEGYVFTGAGSQWMALVVGEP